AFSLLLKVVDELEKENGPPLMSGLKNQLRKRQPDFSEKRYGFGGFLQFCKAAQARGLIEFEWDDNAGDYVLRSI
ncbi:MAG: OST-HTH/LOTUS domain-containing protein, partial [Acidimicrobiia bacterium]|nr:OST-HTH/LOTUS domain-containing protein [Acidimicrobiia bacterium]